MDSKNVMPVGKISAVSDWCGANGSADENIFRLRALHKLMRAAEDCDAEALIDVEYSEEHLARSENPGAAPLMRVCATAVAVKLKSA
jgi:uncharacterized protein YbjQ (UPF0145 family)